MDQNQKIESAKRDLQTGAFITFIGVNIMLFVGTTINALVFFNILQTSNPAKRFDIHTPSPPDMYGDSVTIAVFSCAYLFITSKNVRCVVTGLFENLNEASAQQREAYKDLKKYVQRTRNLFFTMATGFGLYFFSKYVLTLGLETAYIENRVTYILNMLNNLMMLGAVLIIVSVFCKYLSSNKFVALAIYLFFIIKHLFATGMFGFVGTYDLHVIAPCLDLLSPVIFIYSLSKVITGNRKITSAAFYR